MLISPEAEELRRRLLHNGTLVLEVKVIPRARSAEVSALTESGRLRVRVRAAPEKGNANNEVCAVLAEYFAVPKGNVEITFGHTSNQKRIKIVRSRPRE